MQTYRRCTFMSAVLILFVLSSSVFAGPSQQVGTAIITPENAHQVAQVAQYGDGAVVDLALSPTADRMAVATTVGVSIIDSETQAIIQRLDGNTDILTMIDWSADGQYIATASDDQIIRVYDANGGDLLYTFPDFIDTINVVAFSPDSNYLLVSAARNDATMRLYRVTTGDMWWTNAFDSKYVLYAVFSADGHTIIGSFSDYSATIWDVETGDIQRAFDTDTFADSIALSDDSTTLFVLDSTHLLSAFDVESGTLLWKTERSNGSIYRLATSEAIDGILVASPDGVLQILSVETGEIIEPFADISVAPQRLIISSDGQTLYASSISFGVFGYSLLAGTLVTQMDQFAIFRGHVPFNAQSDTFFEQAGDQIAEYSVATGDLIAYLPDIVVPPDSFATVLAGHERILIETPTDVEDGNTSSHYSVIDRATGDTLLEIAAPPFYETILISPNARFFAVVLQDATIEVWDVETGDSVTLPIDDSTRESTNDEPRLGRVEWSADGQQLLVTYIDERTIRLWDVLAGSMIGEYEALYGEVNDFLWWQDGSLVAIKFDESILRLWKVDSGEEVLVVTLNETISSAAVSPDFDLIAIGTQLGNMGLVDVESGEILNTMQAHVGDAFVAWSYDGALIRSGGYDYVTRLWGIPNS